MFMLPGIKRRLKRDINDRLAEMIEGMEAFVGRGLKESAMTELRAGMTSRDPCAQDGSNRNRPGGWTDRPAAGIKARQDRDQVLWGMW